MVDATTTFGNETVYLHSLFDTLDQPVIATDAAYVVRYWNDAAERTLGYPAAMILGKKPRSLLKFLWPAEARTSLRKTFLHGDQWKATIQFKTKDSGFLPLQVSASAIRNTAGDKPGYIFLFNRANKQDKQKAVDPAAGLPYRKQGLFETFMENSPILSWIMDKNGLIKYLNPACSRTFHLTQAAIEQPLGEVFPQPMAASIRENATIVYKLKQPYKTIENAITPDGAERIYQVIKFPIETNNVVYVGGWAIDISEESQLRRNLSDSLVKLKTSETILKDALEKEHHLNDMKSRFVSMASHEFRTPLSTILSSIYLLERYTTTEQHAYRLKHTGKIKEAIQHLNDLLEDFLTLGKLEEGKTGVNLKSFDLHVLLSGVVEELELIKKSGQQILVSFTGPNLITSDKQIVRNILLNLLNNALKFSGENKQIVVKASHKNNSVRIVVQDQGIGISKADQDHLFQTFFRGRNAQNIQGTGLGLNIVKQYLTLLKGSVQIESELDKGTTVSISFPSAK
ncbi:sensor histidine kinase [Flavisolibacter nicotianae]|uniref:sensor histidine kinase n=1 Tax=Flavisolibacter nicotianae TaxID=2364882 RepID=UPI0013C4B88B|nr:PAS domain-containing sensor histidine kinase [Flavisolibacter nicotianae]